jgi:hypothetical protein
MNAMSTSSMRDEAAHATTGSGTAAVAVDGPFERFAGLCAIGAGVIGFLYAVAFVILRDPLLSAIFLLASGLLSTAALAGTYARLRPVDAAGALWALLLGIAGALGAATHGGYDLANALHPPAALVAADLPNSVDPRGLLTFGLAGLGLLAVGALIIRGWAFPRPLGWLALILGALLVILYLARLIVLDPTSPAVLAPAVLTGFLLNPAWNIWLGLALWRGQTGE